MFFFLKKKTKKNRVGEFAQSKARASSSSALNRLSSVGVNAALNGHEKDVAKKQLAHGEYLNGALHESYRLNASFDSTLSSRLDCVDDKTGTPQSFRQDYFLNIKPLLSQLVAFT